MKQYLDLLRDIKEKGHRKMDRTGTGTVDTFGKQIRFDLAAGFPAMTTKKLAMKSVIAELLWFLSGSSNIKPLVEQGVGIWNEWPYKSYLIKQGQSVPVSGSEEWKMGMKEFIERIKTDDAFAKEHGELGPIYGYQWRSWPTPNGGHIDQISQLIEQIKKNPSSRRHIVSAWNVADIDEMAISGLPPCHCLFQFDVTDGKLSCQLYQRSADMFLGVPFNIASYALLTMMIAHVTGLQPGEFVHTFGSAHIYFNHFDQVETQLARMPKKLPTMWINPEVRSIFDFKPEDFRLEGYDPDPAISAPIAV